MKTVLVLDANQRSALSVTRSLGKHGIRIITADESTNSLAGSSRYSHNYFKYPSPQSDSSNFIEFISNLYKKTDIKIILPMTELTTTLLLQNRSLFPGVILPFPNLDTIDILADKSKLMRLAKSLDIPTPITLHVDHPDTSSINLQNLHYPIILKPTRSWLERDNTWMHTKVQFAGTYEHAMHILKTDAAFNSPYMLQEMIKGTGQGIFALYNNGQALAFFSHKRLREKPPWGGVSVLSESVELSPTLLEFSRRLLDSVKWHGIAMVEFKVSYDGIPYLMEVNTRFWGSLQLAIDSGIDFPWLLYEMICGKNIDVIDTYNTGNRLRWLLGDIDSLYILLKNENIPIFRKIQTVAQFITPRPFSTHHEINRWNDLGPFFWELKSYIRSLIH